MKTHLNTQPTHKLRLRLAPALAAACLAAALLPAHAQSSFIWDGGDGSSLLWSTPGNWSPDGAPANDFAADFTFAGTVNTGSSSGALTNDLTGGTITNLTFSAGAGSFYLDGNLATNRGSIFNLSGVAQTVNVPMVMGAITNTHFIDVGSGGVNWGSALTAPSAAATVAKVGSGTLRFTNPGSITIGNGSLFSGTNQAMAFNVDEGPVVFDGGPGAVYNITGEAALGRCGPTGNKNVTITIESGKYVSSSWTALARGNGDGSISSDLIVNGSAIFQAQNFSAGYNVGTATLRPKASVTLNGTSQFTTANNNNNNIFGESAGSYFTMAVNDSAQMTVGSGTAARARIGNAGRGILKLTSPTAKVTLNQAHLGDAAGGAGAFYNRGLFVLSSGASIDHFSIGSASGGTNTANNSFGYYLNDTPSLVELKEIGVGGQGGGNGVLEIRQGTVNVTNWITICRGDQTTAGAAQNALLMIRNGTLYGPNSQQFRYGWSGSGLTQYGVIDVGAGGRIGGLGAACAMNLAQTGNANDTAILTLSGGATVELLRIYAGNAAPLSVVNLNGCTLSPLAAVGDFLGANLDGVYVHAGGVTFDTKGIDFGLTAPLLAPMDSGVISIPVVSPGTGYIGRPIVRIAGTGMGATAIAEWDETAGTITGITITCPGSGYFEAPTVQLIGGGFTTAATLGTPVLGSVTSGGLTKKGDGKLTLGSATYTGPTVVMGGTLSVNGATFTPAFGGPLTVNNANLSVDAAGGFSSMVAGNITLQDNAILTFNYGTVQANPYSPAILSSGSLSAPGTNITLNITGFGLQVGQFPLIQYASTTLPDLANFSLGPLPPGVQASLVKGANSVDVNITSAGQNLFWYGSISKDWDINTTLNWNTGTAKYLEYTTTITLGDPVTFDDTLFNDFVSPPATNVNLTTVLQPFLVTVDSTLPYSFSGPGQLGGIGSLVKSNTGSLTIGTSNFYSGGTLLGGGTIAVTDSANLGATSGRLTMAGGTLQVNASLADKRPITFLADSTVRAASGTTATLGGTFSGGGRLIVDDVGTVSVTNNENMGFHVYNGNLVFEGSAKITNLNTFSSIGLGNAPSQNGKLTIRGNATLTINQDLNLGDINDGHGEMYVQDNAIVRTRQLWVGKNATCTGAIYQSGGTVTNYLTDGSDLRLGGNDANGGATFGGYYLSGGRLDLQKNFQIGAYGTGEMVISGGTFNVWGGYPVVGRFTNSVGRMVVSGGQFNQLNTGTFFIVGENGVGTLSISNNGVINLTNAISIGGAGSGPGQGTVLLATGGRMITPGVRMAAAGISTFSFDGGTLQPNGHNGAFMQGLTTANILSHGAIIDSAGFDITITQPLLDGGGNGGLTKAGTGTLTLAGADTYTGPTVVNAGRLLVAPAHQVTGAVTVADGAGFGASLVGGGVVTVGSLTLGTTGATTLDFSLGTNGNPTAPVMVAGAVTVNGTCTIRLAGKLSLGTFPLVKYTGSLGGSGAFSPDVRGPQGVVATLANNTAESTLYVTVTSLGSGIVWTGTNSVTALTNLWDLNSTTNWLIGSTPTTYQESVPPGDTVRFDDTGSGVVILNSSASPTSALITNNTVSYTFRGTGRIAGTGSLTKEGTAAVTMSLAGNDYLGDTVVNGGTFKIGSANAIPDGTGRGTLMVNQAATVEFLGWSETVNGLSGSGLINSTSSTNVTLTVGNGDAGGTWNGTMNNTGSGGVNLIKIGTGTLTVGGNNTLNNGAASQVNGGTLIIATNGYISLPSAEFWIAQNATTGSVVVAGGTLEAVNNWIAIGRNNASAVGTLTVNSGTVIKNGGGNIVLGSLGGSGTLIVNGGQVLNNSMLWLGENTGASGYLYLNGGLVQATQVRPTGTTPAASVAYFNGGTLQASAASDDFIQSTAWVQSKGLVLDDGGFGVTLATAPLQEDPASIGGGLIKSGAGTLYLNTANTYTGLTLVTNGTLAGTGTIAGPVEVAPTGNIGAGVAAVNGGTLNLSSKPLTLQGNATFRVSKVGGVLANDKIAGISTVTYGGKLTLVINPGSETLAEGDTFQLFSAATRSGAFASYNLASPGAGLTWKDNTAVDGSVQVIVGVTPQPPYITIGVSDGNLVFSGTNGTAGMQFRVLSSTEVTAPLANWVPIYTNTFSGNAINFSLPIVPGETKRFYLLAVP